MILGIGTDLVAIVRVEDLLSRHQERFLSRVFTPAERGDCLDRARPAMHLAARLAAKEAAMKALGTGWGFGVRWLDIEIRSGDGTPPSLSWTGAAGARAEALGIRQTLVSLSHDGGYALAWWWRRTDDERRRASEARRGDRGAMIRVATASEMQEMDRRAAAEFGIPSLLLMENAGAETVREILAAFPGIGGLRVLVLCGRGNNGGDGFVIARRLLGRGISVRTVLLAPREVVQGDARINLEILEKLGAPPVEMPEASDLPGLRECLFSADVVVDAIMGTGARGPARDVLAEAIDAVNRSGRPVVSVDIPSGLGADQRRSGRAPPSARRSR